MARSNGSGAPHASPQAARPAARQHPNDAQQAAYPDARGPESRGYAADPRYQDPNAYPNPADAFDPRYAQPSHAQPGNPHYPNSQHGYDADGYPVDHAAGHSDWNEPTQPPREPAPYAHQEPHFGGHHGGGFGQPGPAPRGVGQGHYAPQFDPYLPGQPAEPSASLPAQDPFSAPPAHQGVHRQAFPAQDDFSQDYGQDGYRGQTPDFNEPALRGAAYDDLPPTAAPSRADARYDRGAEAGGHYADAPYQEGFDAGYGHTTARPATTQRPADHGGYGEPDFGLGGGHAHNAGLPRTHDETYGDAYAQPGSTSMGSVHFSGSDYRQQGYAEPGFAHADAYGAGGDMGRQASGEGRSLEQVYDDEYEVEEEYEDDEEPRRSGRMFLIAGALIGAIAVGGGLAYGYKILLGPAGQSDGKPPVVTSGAHPTKVRPEEPGGRQFSHTDSKIMDRLDTNRTSSGTNPDGTRRVNTIVIGRDGAPVPPISAPTPSGNAPINPVVSVPGLTVVDAFAGARAQAPQPPPSATGPIVVSPPSAPAKPVVITNATPTPPKAPSSAPPAQKTAPRAPTQTAAIPPKAPAAPRKTAAKTSPAPAVSSGGNGYVAVLASVPVSSSSQMESLKTFADIQQRYPNVLANKTPEVREANLGEKGRYHRLLVGPPVSRTQANEVCRDLKAAGYSSCWITSF